MRIESTRAGGDVAIPARHAERQAAANWFRLKNDLEPIISLEAIATAGACKNKESIDLTPTPRTRKLMRTLMSDLRYLLFAAR